MAKKSIYEHSGVDHPLYLGIDGQRVFHKVVLHLKERCLWNDAYLESVAAAAGSYEIYTTAKKETLEHGVLTTTQGGALKKNPAVDIAGSAFRDFVSFTSKFGLNPLFAGKVAEGIDPDSEI